jgi:hypothetical protein
MSRARICRIVITSTLLATLFTLAPAPIDRADAAICRPTGEGCAVGMTGPGGGVIFYDAGSQQWWGRFLEAKKVVEPARVPWGPASSIYGADASQAIQRRSMAIGMGRQNTEQMRIAGVPLAGRFPAAEDWYLPSKDELSALYDFWKTRFPAGVRYGAVPAWTSSESEDTFAWYQLFHDGTQFTDANAVIPVLATNKNYLRSPKHTGSDFAPAPMRIIRVRAFPPPTAPPPAPWLVTELTDNPSCSLAGTACRVGDVGPGGGIVVHDAGSPQPWGRYLEIAPKACELSGIPFATKPIGAGVATAVERVRSKWIGAGARNTRRLAVRLRVNGAASAVRALTCGGQNDWFVPSKDELNEAFRWLSHSRTGLKLTPIGQFERGYYWTSSDYNGRTAWTQYFADGQQFDRVGTLARNLAPPSRPLLIRPMRAFGPRTTP